MVSMTRNDKNLRSGGKAVEVRGLVKQHYGTTKALDGVDLDVREGTVLGVPGPSGAGRTTLVRCLSTLVLPDAGHAVVAGYDVVKQPRQLRRTIGLTGQYASVDEKLSGWENLYMIGRLLDLRHIGALVRRDLLQIKKDPESMFDALLIRRAGHRPRPRPRAPRPGPYAPGAGRGR
ncbi:MAG TPA: ATP-binding cassette domain-containing protein [Streptomyces sp.]|nr:ATP-binding cassette domain-containing protein [Streptomyces sp.]HWU07286.1 ATP-binding cassette domain-containing protein [Streptomyces sp.]